MKYLKKITDKDAYESAPFLKSTINKQLIKNEVLSLRIDQLELLLDGALQEITKLNNTKIRN